MLAGPKTRYARQREKCYRVQCERKRAAPSEAVQREAALTATGWGQKIAAADTLPADRVRTAARAGRPKRGLYGHS
jgi:hypothetical protein